MENTRSTRVRLDRMDRRQLLCMQGFNVLCIIFALCIAALGPSQLTEKQPAGSSGTGVMLANATASAPRNFCFYDSPIADTTAYSPITNCWSHRFRFHNVFSNFFKLDLVANRKPGWLGRGDVDEEIHLELSWWGSSEEDVWEEIASEEVLRKVSCPDANAPCDRDILFQASHILYETYWFMVRIPPDRLREAAFIESVDFFFIYENREFATYELAFKYSFCALAVLCAGYWHIVCRKAVGRGACTLWPYHSFEQSWIAVLILAVIFFDWPLYALEYSDHDDVRRFVGVAGIMFEFTCATLFLLWWLCLFDALPKKQHDLRFWSFYLPKLLFFSVFWAGGVAAYTWVVLQGIDDPLYNWYEDQGHWLYIRVFAAVFASLYLAWVVYLLCKASYELQAMSRAAQLMYFGHAWRCLALLGGMLFGAVYMLEVDDAQDLLVFHTLLNFYVIELAMVYTPVAALTGSSDSVRMRDPEAAEATRDGSGEYDVSPIGPGSIELVESPSASSGWSTASGVGRSTTTPGKDEAFDPSADALGGGDSGAGVGVVALG